MRNKYGRANNIDPMDNNLSNIDELTKWKIIAYACIATLVMFSIMIVDAFIGKLF